jgi:hypothetical protein
VTDAGVRRRDSAVALLLPAAIVAATLSLGLRWRVGAPVAGYQLRTRIFLIAAIALLTLAGYVRGARPARAEGLVLLAAISLTTAVALAVRLFPAPGVVIAAGSLALTVWLKQILRARRLAAATS